MQVVQAVVAFDLTGKNWADVLVLLSQGLCIVIHRPVGRTLSSRV